MLEASDYETGGPSFIGSRRGSYRVGSATAAATMKGELGSVSLDTFGDKKADMFGESGETFVGFHLPDGGLGTVSRDGEAYRFSPL